MNPVLVAVILSIFSLFSSGHGFSERSSSANTALVATQDEDPDVTPPSITASVDPPANEAGWHHSDVHVLWTVEDPESGIASLSGGCQPTTVTANTAERVIECSAMNSAGLSASKEITIRIDSRFPTVTFSTGSKLGAPIFGRNATLSLRAIDNQSITRVEFFLEGSLIAVRTMADDDGAYSMPLDTTVFSEEAPPNISAVAYDIAGNASPARGVLNTSNRGLVAAYSFEEKEGRQVLDTAAHDPGINPNDGKFGSGVTRVPGVFGQALEFDGLKGMITIPDSASLDLKEMTLEAWVKPTRVSGWQTVLLKQWRTDRSQGLVYALYANADADGGPATYVRPAGRSSDQRAAAATLLTPGRWYHLAATYDGTHLRLYTNGSLVTTVAVGSPITTSAMPLFIGGNQLWGEFFTGAIDEIRVYNRALTDAEILSAAPASSRAVTVMDIGTLGGTTTVPNAVNANDQVVGRSETSNGEMHAFIWHAGTGMIDLGTLGGPFSEAIAINIHGQVAGVSRTADGALHAFLWDDKSGMVDLGFPATRIGGVNAGGHVLGGAGLWSPNTGLVPFPLSTFRYGGLNDDDEVVGDDISSGGYAKVWDPTDGFTDLGDGTFIHGRWRTDSHINNRSEITGRLGRDLFVWSKANGFVILRDAAGVAIGGEPTAITSSGDVVGPGFYWNATSGAIRIQQVSGIVAANARGLVVGGGAWSPKDGLLDLSAVLGITCGMRPIVNDNGLVLAACGSKALAVYVEP